VIATAEFSHRKRKAFAKKVGNSKAVNPKVIEEAARMMPQGMIGPERPAKCSVNQETLILCPIVMAQQVHLCFQVLTKRG
jgi:hypothetical protein